MTLFETNDRLEEALRLYWTHHRSFTQISRITGLSFDTVHDVVMDSIRNNYGYKYKPRLILGEEEENND